MMVPNPVGPEDLLHFEDSRLELRRSAGNARHVSQHGREVDLRVSRAPSHVHGMESEGIRIGSLRLERPQEIHGALILPGAHEELVPVHHAQPLCRGTVSPQADALLDVLAAAPARPNGLDVARKPGLTVLQRPVVVDHEAAVDVRLEHLVGRQVDGLRLALVEKVVVQVRDRHAHRVVEDDHALHAVEPVVLQPLHHRDAEVGAHHDPTLLVPVAVRSHHAAGAQVDLVQHGRHAHLQAEQRRNVLVQRAQIHPKAQVLRAVGTFPISSAF
mmetsp:Transcript_7872/g.29489  ORF Transcript_7872/g.29489 Transcript_7872/m.29489 type:complete len:272 (-) Transcript_7872:56-871(-)|eukprot:scaffold2389_cov262-Pinguiococcus_pyrenoidosus.AAC.13